MQRGFLAPAAQHVGGEEGVHGSSRLSDLRAQLADAERELRRCRKERLDLEASLREAEQESRVTVANLQTPPPALPKKAVEALASHEEPPRALHRLAEVLMLVVDGPLLVDLGDHPLPGNIPWRNLQLMLHKSWKKHDAMACAAALQQQPFGVRLREHARERLLGSSAVKRELVAVLDDRCAPVLDFLLALLKPPCSTEESRRLATPATVDMERLALERQRLLEAVDAHEREVASIRKKLQEAKRSEENAHAFAAKHAPCLTASANNEKSSMARSNVIQAVTPKEGCKASVRQDAAAASGNGDHITRSSSSSSSSSNDGSSRHSETAQANGRQMSCSGYPVSHATAQSRFTAARQSIQYRLNEITVPQLQESVLASLASALMEQRGGCDRSLEISGFSDVREEPEIGWRRAQAVVKFLESRGVPTERLNIVTGTVPLGNDGSREFVKQCSTRRVDLVLFDGGESADRSTRQRASEVFSRILDSEVAPCPRPHYENDEAEGATRQLPQEDKLVGSERDVTDLVTQSASAANNDSQVADSKGSQDTQDAGNRLPAPAVSIEEVPALSEGNCAVRGLRVVFMLPGLNAADTNLDVGQEAVRLTSMSSAWPEVDALLPFLVRPPTERAAQFSRKKGTLTLHLTAA
mmetsp:Transcript_76858/g.148487  ORF Transcript_76858/g.148487 Transcript_76858/m.148487 type:complete len:641 (+) Transcript_76858:72-1994(+)